MRTSPQRERHESSPTSATPSPQADVKRRRFLLALGAGSAATAAATAQAIVAPVVPAAPVSAPDEKTSGYRETDHVRNYYASTRL
jgi:hypothetical protein